MKRIYTIRDTVAETVGPLVVFAVDAAAVRLFTDNLADMQTQLSKHPDDFELVCCGTIDDDGQLTPEGDSYGDGGQPRVVLTGRQWREMREAAAAAQGELRLAKEA